VDLAAALLKGQLPCSDRYACYSNSTRRYAAMLLTSTQTKVSSNWVGSTQRYVPFRPRPLALTTLSWCFGCRGAVPCWVLVVYFLADLPRTSRRSTGLVPLRHRPRFGLLADEVITRVGGTCWATWPPPSWRS